VGYALHNKFSIMDYAKDINLVSLRTPHIIKDFVILKSFIFAKNFAATAVGQFITYSKVNLDQIYNGIVVICNFNVNVPIIVHCIDNGNFLLKFKNFINVVQEFGLFLGALFVDLFIVLLKCLGIIKDVNNFTIDPNYQANIRNIPKRIYNHVSTIYHHHQTQEIGIANAIPVAPSLLRNYEEDSSVREKKKVKTRKQIIQDDKTDKTTVTKDKQPGHYAVVSQALGTKRNIAILDSSFADIGDDKTVLAINLSKHRTCPD
jgi:hypothetical protein